MLSLEGIPAFYIHSLLATPNDHDGVEKTGVNRAINRHRWDYPSLRKLLDDPETIHAQVLARLKRRIAIRTRQPAFHPNATQFTLQLGEGIFGVWRQSLDRSQSIFALHNLTGETIALPVFSINLIGGENWVDLLSDEPVDAARGEIELAPYQCRWISNRH